MSKQELVDAYVEGRISRKVFIRRLVAAGVTLTAAGTYAAALRPGRASAFHSEAQCKDKFLRDGDKDKFLKCMEQIARKRAECKEKFLRDGDKDKLMKCLAKLD
jgi:hypothetical protein